MRTAGDIIVTGMVILAAVILAIRAAGFELFAG